MTTFFSARCSPGPVGLREIPQSSQRGMAQGDAPMVGSAISLPIRRFAEARDEPVGFALSAGGGPE
jgi:hypothetical protein